MQSVPLILGRFGLPNWLFLYIFLSWIAKFLDWFATVLDWFAAILDWFAAILHWFATVLDWFAAILHWFATVVDTISTVLSWFGAKKGWFYQFRGIFPRARRIVVRNLDPGPANTFMFRDLGDTTGSGPWSSPVSHVAT